MTTEVKVPANYAQLLAAAAPPLTNAQGIRLRQLLMPHLYPQDEPRPAAQCRPRVDRKAA